MPYLQSIYKHILLYIICIIFGTSAYKEALAATEASKKPSDTTERRKDLSLTEEDWEDLIPVEEERLINHSKRSDTFNAVIQAGFNAGFLEIGETKIPNIGAIAGLGLQKIYPTNRLYIGIDFVYQFLTGQTILYPNPNLSNLDLHIFGVKMKVGRLIMDDTLKVYFSLGLMGIALRSSYMPTADVNFMPLFGIGIAKDIVKGRLALFTEIEGGPLVSVHSSVVLAGQFIINTGFKAYF